MSPNNSKVSLWQASLEATRLRLARPDALLQLAMLGIIAGILSGLVIVAFRLLVEETTAYWLPGGSEENYEGLSVAYRALLPLGGSLLLALLFVWFGKGIKVLGVAHVMERMAYHQGHHTLRAFLLQFFGAGIAIASGHSVGREGPHVFLGAAVSSLFGQRLQLPNNSIRTLVGCGTAAAIAASFNTPLAGVIFALEVVMMEYTLASFIPVILAAASATLVSVITFGNDPGFIIQPVAFSKLADVPMILLLGLLAGTVSTAMILLVKFIAGRVSGLSMWARLLLAGMAMIPFAVWLPQAMGIGYDTVNQLLAGNMLLLTAALLVVGKLLATSSVIGLSIPGGIIGPSLFIGAALGAFCEALAVTMGVEVPSGLLPLLGMGAMMGSALQAPLSALTAVMELTHSPGVIMPGMLAIVVASLTASELFRQESIFITMMRASGLDYHQSPVLQALRRIGVASTMSSDFGRTQQLITRDEATHLLKEKPAWLLIEKDQEPGLLLRAVDLASFVEEMQDSGHDLKEMIDLFEIPGLRLDTMPVSLRATLQEALEILDGNAVEALYVQGNAATGVSRVYGILTREMVESAYRN